jgi:sugar transferase (PEP-CTERM/EpsH1 system associated)
VGNLLYLVHRLPYPPNKGDKVRSYHLLKHLAARHRVFLGTFIDDPEDEVHLDTVRALCADLHVARLDPRWAKVRSINGLLGEDPMTLRYYRDAGLQEWVDRTYREQGIDAAVVFSSSMAQYVDQIPRLLMLVDFVDVDSAKWAEYARKHRWPLSWIYGREGRTLLNYERQVAQRAARSFFVTDSEVDLFRRLAPECAVRVETMNNGVDADYFAPAADLQNPYPADGRAVVFTGAMDYWPNVDAVTWFAQEILPLLRQKDPQVHFWIVGRSPTAAVLALAGTHVTVTGTVVDVRPYLQHAAVVVAPLRLARGIQNKILEAMAMGRPVVASSTCAGPIDAEQGSDLLAADSAADHADAVAALLADPVRAERVGLAGRRRVLARYSWEAHLSGIDRYLAGGVPHEVQE